MLFIMLKKQNGGFETKPIITSDPMYMPQEAPAKRVYVILNFFDCRSLYEQIKANQIKEEDELAERRKAMYGVRPMDDEEYKDYQMMSISKRKREEEDKQRLHREEKVFRL